MVAFHALHQVALGQRDGESGGEPAVVAFGEKNAQAAVAQGKEVVEIATDGFGGQAGGGDVQAGDVRHGVGQEAQLGLAGGRDFGFERFALGDMARVERADLFLREHAAPPETEHTEQ